MATVYSFRNTEGLQSRRDYGPRMEKVRIVGSVLSDLAKCSTPEEVAAIRQKMSFDGLVQEPFKFSMDRDKGVFTFSDGETSTTIWKAVVFDVNDLRAELSAEGKNSDDYEITFDDITGVFTVTAASGKETVTYDKEDLIEELFNERCLRVILQSVYEGTTALRGEVSGTRPPSMFHYAGYVFRKPRNTVERFLKNPWILIPALVFAIPVLPQIALGVFGLGLARKEPYRLGIILNGLGARSAGAAVRKQLERLLSREDTRIRSLENSRIREQDGNTKEETSRKEQVLSEEPVTEEAEATSADLFPQEEAAEELSGIATDTGYIQQSPPTEEDIRKARTEARERALKEAGNEQKANAARYVQPSRDTDLISLKQRLASELAALQKAYSDYGFRSTRPVDTLLVAEEIIRKYSDGPSESSFREAESQMKELLSSASSERRSLEAAALSSGKIHVISPEEKVTEALRETGMLLADATGMHLPLYPAQNVNGNLYPGSSQLLLTAHMSKNGYSVPVFLSEDQLVKYGIEKTGPGVMLLHRSGDELTGQRVYNLLETDFVKKYPELPARLQEYFGARALSQVDVDAYRKCVDAIEKKGLRSESEKKISYNILSSLFGISLRQLPEEDGGKLLSDYRLENGDAFQRVISASGGNGFSLNDLSYLSETAREAMSAAAEASPEHGKGIDIDAVFERLMIDGRRSKGQEEDEGYVVDVVEDDDIVEADVQTAAESLGY